MNRRSLFSFLATAPLSATMAVAAFKAEPVPPVDTPVRASGTIKCVCGSPLHHTMALVKEQMFTPMANTAFGAVVGQVVPVYVAKEVCSWCGRWWQAAQGPAPEHQGNA